MNCATDEHSLKTIILFPEKVYLHVGTRRGARAVGLDARVGFLEMADLPSELHVLKPHEVEDAMCFFMEELASPRHTLVHGGPVRRSWRG